MRWGRPDCLRLVTVPNELCVEWDGRASFAELHVSAMRKRVVHVLVVPPTAIKQAQPSNPTFFCRGLIMVACFLLTVVCAKGSSHSVVPERVRFQRVSSCSIKRCILELSEESWVIHASSHLVLCTCRKDKGWLRSQIRAHKCTCLEPPRDTGT